MKSMSQLALAAALTAGLATPAFLAPAVAAKKEAPGPKFSPEFLKAAQPAQAAIQAKDWATAETQVAAAEAAAKNDDEKYTVAALRYDFEQNRIAAQRAANPSAPVDEAKLVAPMQALLANAQTPADAKARYTFRLGSIAYSRNQFAVAQQYLSQAQQMGYKDENLPLLIAQSKVGAGDVRGGLAALDQVIQQSTAAGQKAPENYYKYAFSKANAAKMRPEAVSWLARYAAAYPTKEVWRAVILNYGLQQGSIATPDRDQKLDLYRLLRATGGLADQSLYSEYAFAAKDRGLPAEYLSVLQEGIASGKLAASSAAVKAQLADAQRQSKAEGSLAPLDTRSRAAADGKLAMQTADAYLNQSQWAKAADLYKVALGKGGVDADTVQTRLGIALARSGDKAGAQAAFGAVKGQPRAEIAQLWTAYVSQSAA